VTVAEPAGSDVDTADSPALRRVAVAVFALGLFVSLAALIRTWERPVLEAHSFRQTQTALTAYWLAKGGPWLAYETPSLGAPWAVPFEFPVYQAAVAVVHRLLGIHLDAAGRLVSWLCFMLAMWQLHAVIRKLGGSRHMGLLICGLVMLSPHYVFWSRTFMIESTGLLFGMAFVSAVLTHLHRPGWGSAAAMAVLATLGALVKVTTFVPFGVAAGMLVVRDLFQDGHFKDVRCWLRRYVPVALAGIVALAVLSLWVAFADRLKVSHTFGRNLTSENLKPWLYGSTAQKLSWPFWRDVVFNYRMLETLGRPVLLLVTLAVAVVFGRRAVAWALVLLVLYAIPFAMFTNLHMIHDYYQYANGLFVVCVVGVVAWHARPGWRRWIAVALIGCTVASMIQRTWKYEWKHMIARTDGWTTMVIGRAVRDLPEDGVLLVFGYDWSSEIAYYGEHRAITVPAWTSLEQLEVIHNQPELIADGRRIVGVIDCPNNLTGYPHLKPIFDAIVERQTRGMHSTVIHGCTVWR
jgi:hypothetical protein